MCMSVCIYACVSLIPLFFVLYISDANGRTPENGRGHSSSSSYSNHDSSDPNRRFSSPFERFESPYAGIYT